MIDLAHIELLVERFVIGTDDINNESDWTAFHEDLKSYVNGEIAKELRKIPQVDIELETYLWQRIDELEAKSN